VPILLYQQSNIEIFWNEEEQWLHVRWLGNQTSNEVQRDCEQMLRLLAAKNADSVLNDMTMVDSAIVGLGDWQAREWFPKMRGAGLQYFAWLYSPARVAQLAPDAALEAGMPGRARIFDDPEEAKTWLRAHRQRAKARTQKIILPPNWKKGH
jgi:hypothetical protein